MHITNDPKLFRDGYIYRRHDVDIWFGWPKDEHPPRDFFTQPPYYDELSAVARRVLALHDASCRRATVSKVFVDMWKSTPDYDDNELRTSYVETNWRGVQRHRPGTMIYVLLLIGAAFSLALLVLMQI
jgi:hypothetical protein